MAFHTSLTSRTAHASQMTAANTVSPRRNVAERTAATRRPPMVCALGTKSTAGGLRTVATRTSRGSKYLSTEACSFLVVAARLTQLQPYVVQERAKGVTGGLQPVEGTGDDIGGPLRRGNQVIDYEGNACPGQNLLQHGDHLPCVAL